MNSRKMICALMILFLSLTRAGTAGYDMIPAAAVSAASEKLPAPVISKTVTGTDNTVISWKKVNGAKKYRIYRQEQSKQWFVYGEVEDTSVTVSSLSDSMIYYFRVVPLSEKNGKLTEGKSSKKIKIKTKAVKVPKLPHPQNYGFSALPEKYRSTGEANEQYSNHFGGYLETASADPHFLEKGAELFDGYCRALEKKGFLLISEPAYAEPTKDENGKTAGYTMYIPYKLMYRGKYAADLSFSFICVYDGSKISGYDAGYISSCMVFLDL
ncbi:MAG: fibronectin type III domain-containing protein [Oscillospiraceae bacterium]|nr:fibronectin type III domain-containing protein [Oscillospiraceae bacterium]